MNALFFNDDTMHQIYEDEGVFNFIYHLPQIAYSTLITFFIDNILSFLSLSEDIIIKIKNDKNLENLSKNGNNIKSILETKFILFFIVNFIFVSLFWYYLSCFCAVYTHTQYHVIKDTLISFGIGFATPLGINILTSLLRIYSLKDYNKSKRLMFRFSKLFQQWL